MDDGHMASSSSAAPVKQETSETGRASPAHQPQQCISVAPTIVTPQDAIEESQLRPAEFSVLSPSARTSHTRVDLSLNPEEETPAAEAEADEVEPAVPHVPQVSLTFLLVSGRRRTMSFDHEATVGRVKELVWNAWPNGPSYLRILYLGKILQDDDTLSKVGFPTVVSTAETGQSSTSPPTIVHLSIRAYAPPGADETPKKKGRRRRTRSEGEERAEGEEDDEGGCQCCIIC
ncbi:unnamed protein product [Somion occarium]|uniref:Ubiquitin-like domain-containing protein n=1 Tax=Somion occarium TaxID=3059160 RepID=A0ABP1DNF3_9APHY